MKPAAATNSAAAGKTNRAQLQFRWWFQRLSERERTFATLAFSTILSKSLLASIPKLNAAELRMFFARGSFIRSARACSQAITSLVPSRLPSMYCRTRAMDPVHLLDFAPTLWRRGARRPTLRPLQQRAGHSFRRRDRLGNLAAGTSCSGSTLRPNCVRYEAFLRASRKG